MALNQMLIAEAIAHNASPARAAVLILTAQALSVI
jgi:hypothetical protein